MKKKINTNVLTKKQTLLVVFVAAFAAIGIYLLAQSRAATITYVNFLNAQSAATSAGVSKVTDSISYVGTQTVSQVGAGSKLTYVLGGKALPQKYCYFIRAFNYKGTIYTASVELVGTYNAVTFTVPVSANYNQYCVGTGTAAQKYYNVANKSPLGGPSILIYQTVVYY